MKPRVLFLAAWLALASALAAAANDDIRFSATLATAERKESGVERFTSDQVAVLDALVRRDVAAIGSGRGAPGATFSQRLSPDERTNSGFALLTPAETARLDGIVERYEMPKVARSLLSRPVFVSRPAPLRVERNPDENPIHGSFSVSYGVGSGGYSEMSGSMVLRMEDPKGRYAISVGYSESRVKNGYPSYYRDAYGDDPFLRRDPLDGTVPKSDFTTRGQSLSAELNLSKMLGERN